MFSVRYTLKGIIYPEGHDILCICTLKGIIWRIYSGCMRHTREGEGYAVSYPPGYRRAILIKYGINFSYHTIQGTGACLKNHSRHPHFLVRVIFTPDSGYIARYTGSYDASCPLGMRPSSGVNLPCHAL